MIVVSLGGAKSQDPRESLKDENCTERSMISNHHPTLVGHVQSRVVVVPQSSSPSLAADIREICTSYELATKVL